MNGRRTAAESWDAFEAPEGAPLLEVVRQSHPWSAVRHWLLDVAEELAAGGRDGTLHRGLDLAHVWVTPDGNARLIDFPVAGDTIPAEPQSDAPGEKAAQALLHRIAFSALRGRGPDLGETTGEASALLLPLHARALLDDLSRGACEDLGAVVERLKHVVGEAPTLTRMRRGAHLACAHLPSLGILVTALVGTTVTLTLNKASDVADVAEREVCMRTLSAAPLSATPTSVDREALEIYVAGRFGALAQRVDSPVEGRQVSQPRAGPLQRFRRASREGPLGALDEQHRARLLSIFERYPDPDPEVVRAAE